MAGLQYYWWYKESRRKSKHESLKEYTDCSILNWHYLYLQLCRGWLRPTCPPLTCLLWTKRTPLLKKRRESKRRNASRDPQTQVGKTGLLCILYWHFYRMFAYIFELPFLSGLEDESKPIRDQNAPLDSLAGSADVSCHQSDRGEGEEEEEGKGE